MTAPGTMLLSKMLVPETEKPRTGGKVQMADIERDHERAGRDFARDGRRLALAINVRAMLISFIALIYLADGIFGFVHSHDIGWFPSSLEQVFGWVFSPVAWLIGIPWHDCPTIGNLLGLRMVTNELVAFQRLGPMKRRSIRARLRLPHSRYADLRISARSEFRSAGSARSRRIARAIWRDSAFAR